MFMIIRSLKNYTLHILPVSAVNAEAFDLPDEKNALIVCTAQTNKYIDSFPSENKLIISFPDISDSSRPGTFSNVHARVVISFVKGLSCNVSDIYICCSQGSSRSTAVAAALLKMSGRSDAPVWRNPYYNPNPLVYRLLCKAYGVFMPRCIVKFKSLINRIEFRRTKKGHAKDTKYERWEIIE